MATHSDIGASQLILTLVAVRLATIVVVSLLVLTAFALPHQDEVACGPVEPKPMQARGSQDPIDGAIQDMLHHD